MLDQFQPHTTIAVADIERAKTWYRDKLGLEPASEDMGGVWYDCAGGKFALFPTPFAGTAQNTVMEWSVDDVEKIVQDLKGRGVAFDTFEMEGVTWEGEIASMGGHKGVWFKDSEGNTLAITQ